MNDLCNLLFLVCLCMQIRVQQGGNSKGHFVLGPILYTICTQVLSLYSIVRVVLRACIVNSAHSEYSRCTRVTFYKYVQLSLNNKL